jgi:Predicted integral membrane protein
VQRAGDKVRVNVQLIDARADTHLWANSYDRDFKDVLAVESEVAAQIADALKANLSPSESHVLAAARTENTEAYDLFLRGQYEFHQAEAVWPQTPTIVPTRFTGRRWHAIQTLPRPPRSSHAIDYRDTGSSLLWRQRN